MEKEDESSPVLVVAASLDGGEEGVGSSGTLMWLRAEQSSGLWTVHNIVIEKVKLAQWKWCSKNRKEGESSPALMVTASLDSGGEGIGGGSLQLCLLTEITTGLWIVNSNVIEKNKLLPVKIPLFFISKGIWSTPIPSVVKGLGIWKRLSGVILEYQFPPNLATGLSL